jgi:hypothetical protein
MRDLTTLESLMSRADVGLLLLEEADQAARHTHLGKTTRHLEKNEDEVTKWCYCWGK